MTWERLFARAGEYDVTLEDVLTTLRERRNRDRDRNRNQDQDRNRDQDRKHG